MESVAHSAAPPGVAPSQADRLRSGKGHRDENFPVASHLIHPRHRAPILAFYNYVRTADDIADHACLSEAEKLRLLDQLEATLLGQGDEEPAALALREILAERNMSTQHAQDLLTAFRMDVTKLRYQDWDDLIGYCRYSAMPVGRFVLDVHGESRDTWPANDDLCAALQIINHLQDCGQDYRDLNRVYVPQDALAAAGATTEELRLAAAPAGLLRCLQDLAARTGGLLDASLQFPIAVRDWRLALEISVIQTYAKRIVSMLKSRDPLSEQVHLRPVGFAVLGVAGIVAGLLRRSVSSGRRMAGG